MACKRPSQLSPPRGEGGDGGVGPDHHRPQHKGDNQCEADPLAKWQPGRGGAAEPRETEERRLRRLVALSRGRAEVAAEGAEVEGDGEEEVDRAGEQPADEPQQRLEEGDL